MEDFPVTGYSGEVGILSRGRSAVWALFEREPRPELALDPYWLARHWQECAVRFEGLSAGLAQRVVHCDVWPPNVICRDGRVTGVIDFDDCCVAPPIVDLAQAVMEFAMFRSTTLEPDVALGVLVGYFEAGGTMDEREEGLLVASKETACAMWLAYELIEAPALDEAHAFRDRIVTVLGDAAARRSFEGQLQTSIRE